MLLSSKYIKTGAQLIVCLFFVSNLLSQTNLIKNPSFENYTLPIDCNGGSFEIPGSPTFHHVVDDWYTFNSPDYFNTVCDVSTSWYNVPNNVFGISYGKTGNGYAGMYIYKQSSESKEYIFQHLTTPLIHDSTYCLSFYTTRADRTPYAIKNLGAYFSVNTPTSATGYYINGTPQVANLSGFLADTINWMEIQGCFTAQGGEQYLTIGNFNSNANTDTLQIQSTTPLPPNQGNDYGYYFIDSVTLWKNNFPTNLRENNKDGIVNIYPNPAKDVINFMFANAVEKRRIELYDVMGNMVLSNQVEANNLVLQTDNISNGIYFYRILVNEKTIKSDKVVIIK